MDATQEQWLPVAGYEGTYEVSNQGRVRSLDRIRVSKNGRRRPFKGTVLSPGTSIGGYQVVSLHDNARRRLSYIHALVLEGFDCLRPPGMVACHYDGNPSNNRIDNLRWDTYSNNQHDKRRHGTDHEVNKTHCPAGHAYDSGNTYRKPGSLGRVCRECRRIKIRERERVLRAARREARNELDKEMRIEVLTDASIETLTELVALLPDEATEMLRAAIRHMTQARYEYDP